MGESRLNNMALNFPFNVIMWAWGNGTMLLMVLAAVIGVLVVFCSGIAFVLYKYSDALMAGKNNLGMSLLGRSLTMLVFRRIMFPLGRMLGPAAADKRMHESARAKYPLLRSSVASGSVAFVGSSTFTYWRDLAQDFSPLPVYNAAFGGSQTRQLHMHMDEMVVQHRPKVVVYFCGTNDLSAGNSATNIAKEFAQYAANLWQALPDTPLVYLNITATPMQRSNGPARLAELVSANRMINEQHASNPMFHNIDTSREAYETDLDNYVNDGLHLNLEGHSKLADVMRPIVQRAWENASK